MYQQFRYATLAICGALLLGLTLFSAQATFAQAIEDDEYTPAWTGYQGYLTDSDGNPYNGEADLYFGLYDAPTEGNKVWSKYYDNWTINDGYFDVKLGGSDKPMGHWNFDGNQRYLETKVCRSATCAEDGTGDGWETMPRQPMGSTPYAMRAHRAYSATHASMVDWDGVMNKPSGMNGGGYKYYVSVAKEGGDYTSVYDAMDSIKDATKDTPYVLYVAPGKYEETKIIEAKPYVYIKGSGKDSTTVYNGTTDKTMVLKSHVYMSDMTVRNEYSGGNSYAVYAHETEYGEVDSTYLYNMDAYADYYDGNSYGPHNHYGAYLYGANVKVNMEGVAAYGSWGKDNYGAYMTNGAQLHAKDSDYYGSYGEKTYGLYNTGTGSYIEADKVKSWGRYADNNYGLYNTDGAKVKLTKGHYYGYEGANNWGMYNNGSELKAYDSYGYGDKPAYDGGDTGKAYGLHNTNGAYAYLKGGAYRATEGYQCWGIANNATGVNTLETYGVDAYAKNCEMEHYGVYNQYGKFTAYDGNFYAEAAPTGGAAGQICYGIWNGGDDGNQNYGTYHGYDVSAWGKYCAKDNMGLRNVDHGDAKTYNGTYYGHGGELGYGLYCSGNGSTTHGHNSNYYGTMATQFTVGWASRDTCEADIMGGSHYADANGGTSYGGYCNGKCNASHATMMATGAADNNYGVYNEGPDPANPGYRSTMYLDNMKITAKDTGANRWTTYVKGGDVYASNSKWDDDGDKPNDGKAWGGDTGGGGTMTCAGVHDEKLADAECPQGPLLP